MNNKDFQGQIAQDSITHQRLRVSSKKHALSLPEGSVQQGRSRFYARSVRLVREHGEKWGERCWRLFSTDPLKKKHSVTLMSLGPKAPYRDIVVEDGAVLVYEGHDEPKKNGGVDPKILDQPERRHNNSLTENGKFHKAAQAYKLGEKGPDIIRVYEKCTRKLRRGFGQITATFTLWIRGSSTMEKEMYLSSGWSRLKASRMNH